MRSRGEDFLKRIGERGDKSAKRGHSPWFCRATVIALSIVVAAFSGWAEPVSSNLVIQAVNTLIAQDGQMGCPIEGSVSSVRLCTATNGAAFYVAKLTGGGFVVTSTDTEIDPIIAISSASDLVEDPQNPLWALIVQDMAACHKVVSSNKNRAGARLLTAAAPGNSSASSAAERWARLTSSSGRRLLGASRTGRTTISDVRVEPLLKTKWGQSNVGGTPCFNYYTPRNYLCGCSVTAAAQILRYHKFPTAAVKPKRYRAIFETDRVWIDDEYDDWYDDEADDPHEGYEKVVLSQMGGYYDWDNMPYVPAYGITTDQRKAIGKLTYDLGLAFHADYSRDSTPSSFDMLVTLCREWGYASAREYGLRYYYDWYYDWDNLEYDWDYYEEYEYGLKSILASNLDAKLPVGVTLRGPQMSHAVVADGYGYLAGSFSIHLNFGWDGDSDAWYVMPGTLFEGGYLYGGISWLYGNIYPHGPKSAGIASGRVLSSSARRPIAGLAVTASNQVGKVLRTTTDEKGIYAFILPTIGDPEYWPDGVDPDVAEWPDDEDWVISLEGASPGFYKGEIQDGWDWHYGSYCNNYYGLDFSLQDTVQLRTLTFDANGGSVPPASWSTPVGLAVGVLPTPTRLGYSCVGWYTARDGGTLVTPETLMVPYNVTLYAHWAVNSYKIWLDADGVSVSPSEVSVAYGSAVGVLPTPKWNGHVFDGWYTAPEGGVRVTAETVMVPYDVTLYARWTGIAAGSCADHPIPFTINASVAAYPVSLMRELRVADMAYDDASGVLYCKSSVSRGKMYTIALPVGQDFDVACSDAGALVDYVTYGSLRYCRIDARGISTGTADVLLGIYGGIGARTTVYVVEGDFLAKKLFFDPNGGSCPVASKDVRAGQAVGDLPSATLAGSAFQGWFTARDGGALVTAATLMVNYDVTLYAHWGAVAAGSCLARAVAFPFGSSVATYPVTLSRKWLEDEGRYDDKSGVLYCKASVTRGKVYTVALPVGQPFEVACGDEGALVEYATYGSLRFCRIDARGLSAGTSEIVLALYGDAGSKTTVYVSEGDLVPADAEYENPPAGSCLGKAAALEFGESAIAKTVRLVPEWDEDGECYLAGGVHYLAATASAAGRLTVAVPAASADGCEVTCEGNAAVREDFGGLAFWIFDAKVGDDVVVVLAGARGADATVYTFVGDFIAKKLFFDPNGGTCPVASKDVRAGQPVGELPSATLGGSVFLGWFTAREGGARVTAETVMVNYDVTLYAHWERLALGSCQEAAVPFAMTTSVAAYPVALAREWLEDELKYSDEYGALYCKTTLTRGKVYTMAVPHGLEEVNAWCVNGEASVTFGSDASLQYVRFDTTNMASEETEAYFAVFDYAGRRTTVYAVEADVMP